MKHVRPPSTAQAYLAARSLSSSEPSPAPAAPARQKRGYVRSGKYTKLARMKTAQSALAAAAAFAEASDDEEGTPSPDYSPGSPKQKPSSLVRRSSDLGPHRDSTAKEFKRPTAADSEKDRTTRTQTEIY